MIQAGTDYIEAISGPARTLDMKICLDGDDVPCSIVSLSMTKGSCGADAFQIGGIYSQFAQIICDELNTPLKGEEITLHTGVELEDGTYEYIQVGQFMVSDSQRKIYAGGYRSTLTCAGRLSWAFDVPLVIATDQTISNCLDAISELTGVDIDASDFTSAELSSEIQKDMNGISCKEALSIVSTLLGGYCTETSGDDVTIRKYAVSPSLTISGEEPDMSEGTFEITGLSVLVTEASEGDEEDAPEIPEVSYSRGVVNVEMTNAYCTEDIFDVMYANLDGFEYRPGTAVIRVADPRLEPWDAVRFNVTGADGDILATYDIPCMNILYMYDGGLTCTVAAPGDVVNDSSEFISPMLKQV